MAGSVPFFNPLGTGTNGVSPTITAKAPQGAPPPGYTWDSTKNTFVPLVGSAENAASLQSRKQSIQDIGNQQEQQLFGKLSNALDGLNMSSRSGFGSVPDFSPISMSASATVPQVAAPDNSAVTAAADAAHAADFGKAKATAGSLGRSAVNSLQSELASRGILGGGTEGRGLVDRLAAATNPLSDINAKQLDENTQIAQHNQDLQASANQSGYQGAITQRGQNIQQNEAQNQAALEARSQNMQMAIAKQQALTAALSGLTGRLNVGLSY